MAATITMTYDVAMWIAKDTATARMRKAGRTVWNRADLNEYARTFYALFGTTAEQYHADMMAGKPDPIPPRGTPIFEPAHPRRRRAVKKAA